MRDEITVAAKNDPRDETIDRLNDLLSAYRMAFALTNLPSKIKVLDAMKDNGCEGAAMAMERDFDSDFAQGLRRAYAVNGR